MFQREYELYVSQIQEFERRVKRAIYSSPANVTCEFARSEDPVPFEKRSGLTYKPIVRGEKWGETWDSAWFHISSVIPESFAGKEVALLFDAGGESLIFDAAGCPVYALTGGSVFSEDFEKNRFLLTESAKGGEPIDCWIESAANGLFGVALDAAHEKPEHPYGRFVGLLNSACIAVFNREIWALHLDLEVLIGLVTYIPETDYRKYKLIRILSDAANAYAEDPRNTGKAREILKKAFALHAQDSALTAHAVGHAHIDTGWLWPVRESIRKCARTFASQIALMEKYPDYVFGASAAQHYAFIKQHYPALYKKIKAAVKAGRWEIQGGMWVEADCNLISGESMVRQFLHGKNFFMDEFGVDVKNLWIPDVFGYSASMPQIIRKSACGFFLTQKLSWSQFNKFPYQTFQWRGIDGSKIITHFPPENTYNASVHPRELCKAQDTFMERDTLSGFISLFGIGDGGGGPCEEHIERGLRMRDLEGCPKFRFDRADRFFDDLSKEAGSLPEWDGELYLEFHRGTLTTQSRTKRNNRKLEQLLTETEFLASMLPLDEYPAEKLDAAWKKLLINQFHDIIPGSSITKVYQTTEKEHAELIALCRTLQKETAARLFKPDSGAAVLLHSLSCDCETPVELPEDWNGFRVLAEDGRELPAQFENGRTVVMVPLKKSSLTTIRKGEKTAVPSAVPASDALVLENEFVRYEFSPCAELLRAYDKIGKREILKSGEKGNVLSLYADYPHCYEAWDIELYYPKQFLENAVPVSVRKTAEGAVRSILSFDLRISGSTIHQDVVLDSGSARLDFRTTANWREERKMLRTAFPVNVFTSEAAFDIQYGFVKRAMHNNTSWDIAKFEVCGQRYADISCDRYGVALLNDCKYGYRVKDGVIDLALLRSPKHPDWDADRGTQVFTYSLFPHEGDLIHSQVMTQAALLNRSPELFNGCAAEIQTPCALESDCVSLEIVKKAEKEDCLVLRMVETKGQGGKARLRWNGKAETLVETNLLEWTGEAVIPRSGNGFDLTFAPFEIRTFKVK